MRVLGVLFPTTLSCVLFMACSSSPTVPIVADAGVDPATPEPMIPADTPPAPPPAIVAVDTVVATGDIPAGSPIDVTCVFIADDGETYIDGELPDATVLMEPATSFVEPETEGAPRIAARVGDGVATCSVPSLQLIDDSPATFHIVPGIPSVVETELSDITVMAGESVDANCTTFDAYGNEVPDAAARLIVDPMGDGTVVEDMSMTFERVNRYTVSCQVDGSEVTMPALLDVSPALPYTLATTLDPERTSYEAGEVVSLKYIITDVYGNEIDDADVRSLSSGNAFGTNRYRFDSEGTNYVLVNVASPTHDDKALTSFLELEVGGAGPRINCTSPGEGVMIDRAAGSTYSFRGTATDPNGLASVRVNGSLVTLNGSGEFTYNLPVRWGMNFVDIIAVDELGEQNSHVCSFLASDTWFHATNYTNDVVSFELNRGAFDDNSANSPITSVQDMMQTMLDGTQLRNTLHSTLAGLNPLKPMSCDWDTFLGCGFRSRIDYEGLSWGGPHTAAITTVAGGLEASVTLRNFGVALDVDGTVETEGWIRADEASVTIRFNVQLLNGVPRVTINTASVNLEIDDIDFDGFWGFIIDIFEGLIEDVVEDKVESAVGNLLRDKLNEVFDGLFANLDLTNTLGNPSFDVPRIGGGSPLHINVGAGFSSISATSSDIRLGMKVRFTGPSAHARSSLGVAVPDGAAASNPSTGNPMPTVGAGLHVGVVNQLLHTMWRAGYFDIDADGDTFGDLPANARVEIDALLPPVAQLQSNRRIKVGLGGLRMTITHPDVFPAGQEVIVGAIASAETNVGAQDLTVQNVTIDELHLATPGIAMSAEDREVIEEFLRDVIQHIVDEALTDGLPAIPIPSFEIPASAGPYGLPAGQIFGLINPSMSFTSPHLFLSGSLGQLH